MGASVWILESALVCLLSQIAESGITQSEKDHRACPLSVDLSGNYQSPFRLQSDQLGSP